MHRNEFKLSSQSLILFFFCFFIVPKRSEIETVCHLFIVEKMKKTLPLQWTFHFEVHKNRNEITNIDNKVKAKLFKTLKMEAKTKKEKKQEFLQVLIALHVWRKLIN